MNTQSLFVLLVYIVTLWSKVLLTNTLHWLIVCHSKNCEVHIISSWKQKVYYKNTAMRFLLIFNSKHLALIEFSVLVPGALVLLNFKEKWLKKSSVFQRITFALYNLWYSFWNGLDNIINKFCGIAQKCIFNSFNKFWITLFGNRIFDCNTA